MPVDQYELLRIALRIGAAIGVLLVGRWLARQARTKLNEVLAETTLAPSMVRLIVLATYYGILLLTLISALALIGFPVEALLAASAIVVVVLGIALQQSISNLAATIVFMLFQPFRLGELVDANGVLGTVKEIQLFSTVLVTGDNKEITIPNSEIQNNNLVNYTRLGQLRVDFVFTVSYADDLHKVKEALHDILAADERVLADPAPVIFVQSLDESGVSMAVLALRHSGDVDGQLASLRAETRCVHDYLLHEVLTQVPPAMKSFLIKIQWAWLLAAVQAQPSRAIDDTMRG